MNKSDPIQKLEEMKVEVATAEEALADLGPSITLFGSGRAPEDSPHYALAKAAAEVFSKAGYSILTGGGPGIMQAGNEGAFKAGGESVGLNIRLRHEQRPNAFQTRSLYFSHFTSRNFTFFNYSHAFVILPGGVGTLDELFNTITLMSTGKMVNRPVVFMDTQFWGGLIEWFKTQIMARGYVSPEETQLWLLTDDPEEALHFIQNHPPQIPA